MPLNALLFVPAGWLLAFTPHFIKVALISKATRHDNRNASGRVAVQELEGKLGPEKLARVGRLAAAHANGLESLAFFAPGVVAAVASGAPRGVTNAVSATHVGFRLLYNIVYISPPVLNGYLRTLCFLGSTTASWSLWLLAAGNFA